MIYDDDRSTDERYCAEVTEELKNALRHGYFRAGELLQQIKEEKLFGRWDSFRDFVTGELRTTEVQAYRLIFAHQMNEILIKHGCQPPQNERHLRPLRRLKEDPLRILAWERACQQKQDSPPTAADVSREVRRLSDRQPDEETDENYRAFRDALQASQGEYARAHRMLEEGSLDAFLACEDKESFKRRNRLAAAMAKFSLLLDSDGIRISAEDESPE